LDALAALNMPGIEFYSLQKGEPAETELASLKAKNWHGPDLRDYTTELQDFQETAALMEQLDLVISVDTATAHLAGALGKPVWLLNRFDTCWRWLLNRSDSPWYPTLRVYRQECPGDWQGVVHRVRRDLERLAEETLPRARAASR
jgi:ADP-heptose:LPS heptosyltransferase